MALKNSGMIAISESAKSFTLTPLVGQSILVKDIQAIPNVAVTEFITVMIERQTVGYFHTGTTILNHLPFQYDDESRQTIIKHLTGKGFNLTFPVGEGETFKITSSNNWTMLLVEYDIYDASDKKSTDINGSSSSEYFFINYGTNAANISVDTLTTLSDNKNPVEFLNFPFGDPVPSNTVIDIFGIGFPDVTRSGAAKATDWRYTKNLLLTFDRTVLFDNDRNGFPVRGVGSEMAANNTTYYGQGKSYFPYGGQGTPNPIKLFDVPLTFKAGDELSVQLSCGSGGSPGTIQAGDILCAVFIHVKKG